MFVVVYSQFATPTPGPVDNGILSQVISNICLSKLLQFYLFWFIQKERNNKKNNLNLYIWVNNFNKFKV